MKKATAAELGGAAYDSSGNIEGMTGGPSVWVMTGLSPDNQIYVSLHSTQDGAYERLYVKAHEWGVPADRAGEVQPCEVESP